MDHAYAGPITNLNKRSTASHNNIRNHKNKSTDKQEEKKQIKNKRKRGRRRRRRRRREKASLCKTKPQAAGLATVAWRKMDQQEVNVVLQKGRTAKKKTISRACRVKSWWRIMTNSIRKVKEIPRINHHLARRHHGIIILAYFVISYIPTYIYIYNLYIIWSSLNLDREPPKKIRSKTFKNCILDPEGQNLQPFLSERQFEAASSHTRRSSWLRRNQGSLGYRAEIWSH